MNIQDILLAIGKDGCLLLCYCKLANIPLIDLIEQFNMIVEKDIIGPDCFVKDANELLRHFGILDKTVEKRDLLDVKQSEEYIVPYNWNRLTHFVIERDGIITFNSLRYSNCVEKGERSRSVRLLR